MTSIELKIEVAKVLYPDYKAVNGTGLFIGRVVLVPNDLPDDPYDSDESDALARVIELPKVTTSLDACREAWEKDAPDEYWLEVQTVVRSEGKGIRFEAAKATPTQRCLAFLKWKGVEVL